MADITITESYEISGRVWYNGEQVSLCGMDITVDGSKASLARLGQALALYGATLTHHFRLSKIPLQRGVSVFARVFCPEPEVMAFINHLQPQSVQRPARASVPEQPPPPTYGELCELLAAERFERAPVGWRIRHTAGDAPEWFYITARFELEVRPTWSKTGPVRWVWCLHDHVGDPDCERLIHGTESYALYAMRAALAEMERTVLGVHNV